MSDFEELDLTEVGGTLVYEGTSETWNFGWIPPDARTDEEAAAAEAALAGMVPLEIEGETRYGAERQAFLWANWKHPDVMAATGGRLYPGNHQFSGCCVGAGGGNTVFSLAAAQVALGRQELALVPFWLLNYGRSRGPNSGPGEGSQGGTFAQSVREDGIVPADHEGLPAYTWDDGLCWGKSVEMKWSAGRDSPRDLLTEARLHLVKATAVCKSSDNVREAVANGYPVAFCGNWGGLMQCPTQGDPPVLLNRHSGSWAHQQSIHGWWDHPTLGEIFFVLNQWGLRAHGSDPAGGPAGGYWIKKGDVDYQCRQGEVIAYSAFDGFPAPDVEEIPWIF